MDFSKISKSVFSNTLFAAAVEGGRGQINECVWCDINREEGCKVRLAVGCVIQSARDTILCYCHECARRTSRCVQEGKSRHRCERLLAPNVE